MPYGGHRLAAVCLVRHCYNCRVYGAYCSECVLRLDRQPGRKCKRLRSRLRTEYNTVCEFGACYKYCIHGEKQNGASDHKTDRSGLGGRSPLQGLLPATQLATC